MNASQESAHCRTLGCSGAEAGFPETGLWAAPTGDRPTGRTQLRDPTGLTDSLSGWRGRHLSGALRSPLTRGKHPGFGDILAVLPSSAPAQNRCNWRRRPGKGRKCSPNPQATCYDVDHSVPVLRGSGRLAPPQPPTTPAITFPHVWDTILGAFGGAHTLKKEISSFTETQFTPH